MSRGAPLSYLEVHYAQIVGGTIEAATFDEDEGELWPILLIKMPNGDNFQVMLSQDPEGNGPGHAFIDKEPST